MSKCAVHMQKNKSGSVGGLESHNDRKHDSKKNNDIDKSRTMYNYELIDRKGATYHQSISTRIESLHLKRAVRKDAVVYCSFIVSSDRGFFEQMALEEYRKVRPDADIQAFQELPDMTRMTCMKDGTRPFFEDAAKFLIERYGKENVVNATVHLDEKGAPHMHFGLIPVKDGRLTAKSLFTTLELKALQTDFAERVGAFYGLERGTEGSEATHLTELEYKTAREREKCLEASHELAQTRKETKEVVQNAEYILDDMDSDVQVLSAKFNDLTAKNKVLEDKFHGLFEKVKLMEQTIAKYVNVIVQKKDAVNALDATLERLTKQILTKNDGKISINKLNDIISEEREKVVDHRRSERIEEFLQDDEIKDKFDNFCKQKDIQEHVKDVPGLELDFGRDK